MNKYFTFNACSVAITLLVALEIPAFATPPPPPPSTGAYVADQTRSYVEDATSQGLKLPNTVLCYMRSTGANQSEVLNQGNYLALVDGNKCENSGGAGNTASGNAGATSAPSYIRSVVTATRASDSSPLVGKVWFIEDELHKADDSSVPGIIYAKLTATAPATDTSPYGNFHTDFCGLPTGSTTLADAAFYGYAEGNGASVSAFQAGSQDISMILTGTTTSGSGRIKFSEPSGQSGDWKFAYDANYFHRANSDGSNDQCFDRSFANADKTAWRYGVYKADGSRLERNGGFPIKVGTNYGYVGYWGLWLPNGVNLADGATVTRFSYDGNQASEGDYTLVKKDGRLKKLTLNTTTLDGIKNVPFYYWDNGANYEIKWSGTNLLITGDMVNGNVTPRTTPAVFDASATWNVSGWSQSLGGQVTIMTRNNSGAYVAPTSATVVTYQTETVLTPGGTDWPSTLYCINDCPAGGTTFTSGLNATGSPYQTITVSNFSGGTITQNSHWNWNPVQTALQYSADATSGLLKTAGGSDVAWTAPTAPTDPQFNSGFTSGHLVDATGLNNLKCSNNGGPATGTGDFYCPNKLASVDSYVWETGSNSWNKFSGLKSGSTYVNFDPPLQLTYTVQSAVSTNFANANMILQYNGFGDLQGIPGKCVDPVTNLEVPCANDNSTRWIAAFTIPEGAVVVNGSDTYYVKPLEQELRLKKVAGTNCSTLTLPSIPNNQLPGISSWTDPSALSPSTSIGSVPTVTGAPRVIQGVVQY